MGLRLRKLNIFAAFSLMEIAFQFSFFAASVASEGIYPPYPKAISGKSEGSKVADKRFIIEVEPAKQAKDGKPSMGPAYRSVFAKDGFPQPIPGLGCCWDIFHLSVEKYPNNRMLGHREVIDGKPGMYVWITYIEEVYDLVMKVGNSVRTCGIEDAGRCGIYGANSPEWLISMEACNAHGLYYVPLYDTLDEEDKHILRPRSYRRLRSTFHITTIK